MELPILFWCQPSTAISHEHPAEAEKKLNSDKLSFFQLRPVWQVLFLATAMLVSAPAAGWPWPNHGAMILGFIYLSVCHEKALSQTFAVMS